MTIIGTEFASDYIKPRTTTKVSLEYQVPIFYNNHICIENLKAMEGTMKKICIMLTVFLFLSICTSAFAENRSGENMAADLVFLRPVGIAATVAGAAVFIVALPFALMTNDVPKVAKQLVVNPYNYTFNRPLGDFDYQTDPMLQACPANE